MTTEKMLNVKCFWVICRDDEDFSKEFGSGQLDEARDYLDECQAEHPSYEFELYAKVTP